MTKFKKLTERIAKVIIIMIKFLIFTCYKFFKKYFYNAKNVQKLLQKFDLENHKEKGNAKYIFKYF